MGGVMSHVIRIARRLILGGAVWPLMAVSLVAQGSMPECFVEFAVYDTTGNRLNGFEVENVTGQEERSGMWLGNRQELEPEILRPVRQGSMLYFRRELLDPPTPLFVRLERSQPWRSTSAGIVLTSCRQRESLFLGGNETGVRRQGRLVGCSFDADWWIRYGSLFGPTITYETRVEPTTGLFPLSARYVDRQLIVVGKGNSPIKAFAVDISPMDGEKALGSFDVSDSCPEAS